MILMYILFFLLILLSNEVPELEIIKLREEYIKLGQALKAANLVQDGVEAKYVIQDGEVLVNGEVDTRRGRKLYENDIVSYNGNEIKIIK